MHPGARKNNSLVARPAPVGDTLPAAAHRAEPRSFDRRPVTGLDRGMSETANSKPVIDAPEGPAPAELVVEDVVTGSGAEASAGSTVTVHYLGVGYESGEEFDSSWSRGQSITFPLASLIRGWQEGIPGMKVGGRRKLTVPPSLAYGPAGGHPLGGQTLIFMIDLLGVA